MPTSTVATAAAVPRPARWTGRRRGPGAGHLLAGVTWLIGAVYALPIGWMFLTSFKPEVLAATRPPTLIFTPTLDNYQAVVSTPQFSIAFWNSVLVTGSATFCAVVLALPIAYSMTIRPIEKANDLLFFFISTRMLPIAGVIVPIYLVVQYLGGLDHLLTLIVLYTTMNIPLAVWLLRAYLRDVPAEVIEAARIDGASSLQTMLRIVLPMMRPSLAATATLCAVFAWSEFFIAVSLTTYNAATLPVYLTGFISDRGLFWAKLSAVAVLSALPVLLLGWAAQRPLMRGFSMSTYK